MAFVGDLWLAIIIATIVLWFLSFIAWAVLPHHFGDRTRMAQEDQLMEFLRESDVAPGNYMFPYATSAKEQGEKEYVDKYMAGPRGTLNVYEVPNMGKNMALTIVYFFVTIFTIAYITYNACPPGADFMHVFRIAGTIGVLTYASSGALNRIWFTERFWTHIIDGAAYGIILGLIFALMWPAAT